MSEDEVAALATLINEASWPGGVMAPLWHIRLAERLVEAGVHVERIAPLDVDRLARAIAGALYASDPNDADRDEARAVAREYAALSRRRAALAPDPES